MDTLQTRRPDYERFFSRWEIKWTGPVPIPINIVDENASLDVQTRPEKLDLEHVSRMTYAVKSGTVLPAITVIRVGDKAVIFDGIHRFKVIKGAGERVIAAYVLAPETDSKKLAMVACSINNLNGKPLSVATRAKNALYLLEMGYSQAEAAEACQLNPQAIAFALKVQQADKRAEKLDIKEWDTLPDATRGELARIRNTPVFMAAAEMVIRTKFPSGEMQRKLVNELLVAESESEALTRIKWIRDERLRAGTDLPGRRRSGEVHIEKLRLPSAVGAVMAVTPESVERHFISGPEKEEMLGRVIQAQQHLALIEERLRKGL